MNNKNIANCAIDCNIYKTHLYPIFSLVIFNTTERRTLAQYLSQKKQYDRAYTATLMKSVKGGDVKYHIGKGK